jgi:hypothetical protein
MPNLRFWPKVAAHDAIFTMKNHCQYNARVREFIVSTAGKLCLFECLLCFGNTKQRTGKFSDL